MGYDGYGNVTRVTQPEGNYVDITRDGRGNATQTVNVAKSGSGLGNITTSATYDSSCSDPTCNQPNTVTDARGYTTDYSYDATHGGVTAVTSPAPSGSGSRPETRSSYTLTNGEYQLTGTSTCQTGSSCASSADEIKTTIAYDAASNITSVTTAAGDNSLSATVNSTYNSVGDLATTDGPLSGSDDTVTYRYDNARRVVGIVSPDPDGGGSLKRRAEKRTYDSAGRLTVVENGTVNGTSDIDWAGFTSAQQVTSTYDANSRKVLDTVTASSTTYQVTQYSYDAVGRLECVALRMNPSTWGSLPSSACTLATTGSDGPDRISKYTYDAVGRQTKVQTGYGVSGVQADEVTTTYTDNGKVASVTDAEGNKTSYTYDGHDRLVKTEYPSSSKGAGTSNSSDYEELVLDPNGNVTQRRLRGYASNSNLYIDYAYDTLNRLGSKTPRFEATTTYSYDLLNRMTAATEGSHSLSFSYDALGRNLTQAGPLGTVSYQYDLAGRRTRVTWPDSFYVDYNRLVTGEVSYVRENGASSGVGVLATYTYDDLGRRTGLTAGNGVVTSLGFDAVSRLSSMGHNLAGSGDDVSTSFGYNPAGQIKIQTRSNDAYAWGGHYNVTRGYTTNGLNQYNPVGSVSIGYDARGNLTSSGSDSFGYRLENMLTSATVSSASSTFAYDPLLRLYESAGGSTTRFQYDGADLIGEYNTSGTLLKRYVHGDGTDEPLVEYTGSGTGSGVRTFLQADERGTIVARSDEGGNRTAINSYDEYGIPGSGNIGRFQYTGQIWLPEVGVYHYKARTYSPTIGRFLQTDPIGYEDGMNMYAYVKNDPANKTDPTGTGYWCINGSIGMSCEGGAIEWVDDSYTYGLSDIVVTGLRQSVIDMNSIAWQGTYGGSRGLLDTSLAAMGEGGGAQAAPVAPAQAPPPPPKQPKNQEKHPCLSAIGSGAVKGVIDPTQLINSGLTATAWGAARAGTVAKAALPLGRALNFVKGTGWGLVVTVSLQAAAGGIYAYYSDPRCR